MIDGLGHGGSRCYDIMNLGCQLCVDFSVIGLDDAAADFDGVVFDHANVLEVEKLLQFFGVEGFKAFHIDGVHFQDDGASRCDESDGGFDVFHNDGGIDLELFMGDFDGDGQCQGEKVLLGGGDHLITLGLELCQGVCEGGVNLLNLVSKFFL